MTQSVSIEQASAWYEQDPVHGFDHVLRVYQTAERLARAAGADLEIVQAAALLHDAHPPADGQVERSSHHLTSAAFAGQVLAGLGWQAERISAVQHCIRAHRFRDDSEPPTSLEAQVLFDADKLDAIGAIGAARAVAYAAMHGQTFFARPSEQFLESYQRLPDEPHSAYHEYLFKLRHLPNRLYTAGARQAAAERQAYLQDFFERLQSEVNGLA